MRIVLLTQHFPPDPGPQSRRWGMLSAYFAGQGHQVDVVVPRWRSIEDWTAPQGVTVHTVRSWVQGIRLQRRLLNEALTALGSLAEGWRLARSEPRPDVVIATVPALAALPIALAIGKPFRIPVVADIRDAWPDILEYWREWGDTGTSEAGGHSRRSIHLLMSTLVPVAHALYTAMERASDLVVTTTGSLAAVFRARGMAEVAAVRNTTFGLLAEPLPPPGERRDGTLRVLYLGNIGRAQHLATALRAAVIAQQRGIPVRLRLIGEGAEADAMRQFNERLGHPAEILPRADACDVPDHYRWADTVLVSLRDWAGMQWTVPSKLYEVLHGGRHISASLRGEAAHIVTTSGAGDVVPPEDPEALAQLWGELWQDRSRLDTGSGGPEWIEQNATTDDLSRGYLRLLERLHQRHRHGRRARSRG